MGKLGDGVHTTKGGDRIFVGPDVPRYERDDGGEIMVVEPTGTDSGLSDHDSDPDSDGQ